MLGVHCSCTCSNLQIFIFCAFPVLFITLWPGVWFYGLTKLNFISNGLESDGNLLFILFLKHRQNVCESPELSWNLKSNFFGHHEWSQPLRFLMLSLFKACSIFFDAIVFSCSSCLSIFISMIMRRFFLLYDCSCYLIGSMFAFHTHLFLVFKSAWNNKYLS